MAMTSVDQIVVGIDQHRHRRDPPCRRLRQQRRLGQRDIARALGKEDKADIVGARSRRGFNDGGRPHAADFDLDRHLDALGEDFGGMTAAHGRHPRQSGDLSPSQCNIPGRLIRGTVPVGGKLMTAVVLLIQPARPGGATRPPRGPPCRALRRHLALAEPVATPPTATPRAKAPSKYRNKGASTTRRASRPPKGSRVRETGCAIDDGQGDEQHAKRNDQEAEDELPPQPPLSSGLTP